MRVTGSRLTFTTATNRHSAVSPAVADASLRKGEQPRSVRHIDGPATYAQSRSAQALPQNITHSFATMLSLRPEPELL